MGSGDGHKPPCEGLAPDSISGEGQAGESQLFKASVRRSQAERLGRAKERHGFVCLNSSSGQRQSRGQLQKP